VLRGLRQARGLSQTQLGQLLGVNQKRIARIEAAPQVTSFDQVVRFVSALGGRVLIDDAAATAPSASAPAKTIQKKTGRRKPSDKATGDRETW
jgi:HTH-type transcriptional regulator/antitoxin HipB